MQVRRWLSIAGVAAVTLLVACGGGSAAPEATARSGDAEPSGGGASGVSSDASSGGTEGSGGAAAVYAFPTGPAVTVPEGYTPPGDHVPATGAYLPANGKPTLVFVDAIW